MKIIPTRKMRIGGEHVLAGKPVDVDDVHAQHAIRMGWAVAVEGKKAKPSPDVTNKPPTE